MNPEGKRGDSPLWNLPPAVIGESPYAPVVDEVDDVGEEDESSQAGGRKSLPAST